MSKITNSVNSDEAFYKLTLTDVRDIEVMLGMLESHIAALTHEFLLASNNAVQSLWV